jgi:SpoVK/Ycf46/Vps4 family AAA+-type ATPase
LLVSPPGAWIGKTEKNLAAPFDRAERGGMILFFDEADKPVRQAHRTCTATDRSANQAGVAQGGEVRGGGVRTSDAEAGQAFMKFLTSALRRKRLV